MSKSYVILLKIIGFFLTNFSPKSLSLFLLSAGSIALIGYQAYAGIYHPIAFPESVSGNF
jgi:hypothetical protein